MVWVVLLRVTEISFNYLYMLKKTPVNCTMSVLLFFGQLRKAILFKLLVFLKFPQLQLTEKNKYIWIIFTRHQEK